MQLGFYLVGSLNFGLMKKFFFVPLKNFKITLDKYKYSIYNKYRKK